MLKIAFPSANDQEAMSLQQSSSSCSTGSHLLRIKHFEQFYRRIVKVLDDYVTDANHQDKDGWQEEAVAFYQQLNIRLKQGRSLLDLKNDLLIFCDELRSPINRFLNTVVGSVWAQKMGKVINAPGSSLRTKLINIASEICPLAACYVLDEISVAKQKPINLTSSSQSVYVSFGLCEYDHELLSEESLRVLRIICSDNELQGHFLREAQDNEYHIDAEMLVTEFKNTRRKRVGLF